MGSQVTSSGHTITITIADMYRGVVPFIILQLVTLVIVMVWPELVTWLPTKLLQLQ